MIYKTKPYEKQLEAFNKGWGKKFFALFMQQGTGKTKVTIDLAANYYTEGSINAVLVIAPNGVQEQWAGEQLSIHCPVDYMTFTWRAKNTDSYKRDLYNFIHKENSKLKWFCVNVEAFSTASGMVHFKDYCLKHNVMLVVDEATRVKNPSSKRFFNIAYALNEFSKQRNAVKSVIYNTKYRMILTGTMVTNNVYDLWAMFETMQFYFFRLNYYGFKARYGIEVRENIASRGASFQRLVTMIELKKALAFHKAGYQIEEIAYKMKMQPGDINYIINHPDLIGPYKNLEELKRYIDDYSIIIRKEDCLDLPPKVYMKLIVEMSPDQKKVYKELQQELLSIYNGKELSIQNKLTLSMRLQQVCGGFFPYMENDQKHVAVIEGPNPKLAAMIADIEDTGGEKIIIWARFTAEIRLITETLKKEFKDKVVEAYYGAVGISDRTRIIEQFKQGDIDILVANPQVAGVGLNLQVATLHYYYSNSFSLEDREQSEDRSHRSGQTNTCVYKDIIVKSSIDEKIYNALQNKKSLLEYFRDKPIEDILY